MLCYALLCCDGRTTRATGIKISPSSSHHRLAQGTLQKRVFAHRTTTMYDDAHTNEHDARGHDEDKRRGDEDKRRGDEDERRGDEDDNGSNREYAALRSIVEKAFHQTRALPLEGSVATYIPELAKVPPSQYGVSFCGLDGVEFSTGDATTLFCIQSCCKPFNYMFARREQMRSDNDHHRVHEHVGYEPSGRAFNAFVLNEDGLPHNPLINAGAIMVASLIHPTLEPSVRFGRVQEFYKSLSGGSGNVMFDSGVYLSERHHGDRNRSLAYYMRENGAYPNNDQLSPSTLEEHIELYYQCCAVQMDCRTMARIGATMANGGKPLFTPQSTADEDGGATKYNGDKVTPEYVIDPTIVKDTLTIMQSCGMYDYSGQFAFKVGLPAKSGVSGCIFTVIPGVGGLCIWSPILDVHGNSVRGLQLCSILTMLTQGKYHYMTRSLRSGVTSLSDPLHEIIHAAYSGDIDTLKRIAAAHEKDVHARRMLFERSDYDGRNALHLACAEKHLDIVFFLIEDIGIQPTMKDRWGQTPLDELRVGFDANDTTCPIDVRDRSRVQSLLATTNGAVKNTDGSSPPTTT